MPIKYNPENFIKGLEIVVVNKETLNATLAVYKSHSTKFTSLLYQVILRAMSEALLADTPVGSFVAGTAVDLRHLVPGILNDDIALSFSGA
jgi:hypothetical protein